LSKPSRRLRQRTPLIVKPLFYLTSAILAGTSPARAQQAPSPSAGNALEEIVVTAQKRSENLQSVPISIQAFDAKKLVELQVTTFDDYAKYLPSLSVQSYGPGQAQLYLRGITNGGDGLHVGSQPQVGVYVDEMPVTTIANNLDVHIYDIARVEVLSGPQGTLFGASSETGTMRIITNKPDPTKTEGGYDLTANTFTKGDPGAKVEGFVNLPLAEHAAVRLVAWAQHDGGYISVVQGSPQVYPTSGAVRDNSLFVEKNSNYVDTAGGRAALKVDLSDDWSVTPTVMTQRQTANGQFAYTPFATSVTDLNGANYTLGGTGDLNIARYSPETNRDNWWMATLAVQGKIANFDLVYAAGYIKRNVFTISDYSDYSFFYDALGGYGNYFHDSAGNLISPAQTLVSYNLFTKQSHELRIASPKEWRVRFVAGAFLQRQRNDTRDEYRIANLADPAVADPALLDPSLGNAESLQGLPGVLYLNSQTRTDRDSALFTDLSWDIVGGLTLTGGIRAFHYDNTVYGFFGFDTDSGYSSHGTAQCFTPVNANNPVRPCDNIDYRATKSSETHRINLTYKFDPDRMVYATWSTGFRPGGVNRLTGIAPYTPDYLTNFELGTKTTWLNHRLRINAALFYEIWKDAQFALADLQANSITEIVNAGRSRSQGIEGDVQWRATDALMLSASLTYADAKLTQNACNSPSPDNSCSDPGNSILAPSGSRLPVSSKVKGNAIARYEWSTGAGEAHVQLAGVYQSDVVPSLRTQDNQVLGMQPGYASFDFSTGVQRGNWTAEFFIENLTDKRGEQIRYTTCAPETCSLINVIPIRPRLVGLSFGQRF